MNVPTLYRVVVGPENAPWPGWEMLARAAFWMFMISGMATVEPELAVMKPLGILVGAALVGYWHADMWKSGWLSKPAPVADGGPDRPVEASMEDTQPQTPEEEATP